MTDLGVLSGGPPSACRLFLSFMGVDSAEPSIGESSLFFPLSFVASILYNYAFRHEVPNSYHFLRCILHLL